MIDILFPLYYAVGYAVCIWTYGDFLRRLWGPDHPEAQMERRLDIWLMSLLWAFIWPVVLFYHFADDTGRNRNVK